MRVLYFVLMLSLISCQRNPKRPKPRLINATTNYETNTAEKTLENSIPQENKSKTKAFVPQILNDSLVRNFIRRFGKTDPKWHEYSDTIIDNKEITSFEEYITCDSIVYLYNSPYSTYNKFDRIIDTLSIFDTVIVPYFNEKPFYHRNPCELCWHHRYLCYYKGKYGFFRNNSCIDSSRISQSPNSSFIQYDGDKYVLKEKKGDKLFILPSTGYDWSYDNKYIAFPHTEYITSIGQKTELFYLFLPDGEITLISQGHSPYFIDSTLKILYYENLYKKEHSKLGLSLFDINTKITQRIYEPDDSLSFYNCGPDLCDKSKIEINSYQGINCFSVELNKNELEPDATYIYYFTFQGDSLGFERLY